MKKILLLLLLFSCTRVPDKIEPKIQYAVQDRYLKQLPSPFEPLSETELATGWGHEYQIGLGFAHELDLYLALTTFRRALMLNPPEKRKLELHYNILLCYYLGNKYEEVTYTFENSELKNIPQTFPARHDLLVILYESYLKTERKIQAERILSCIAIDYPETHKKLLLSSALSRGDIQAASAIPDFLTEYEKEKKSPSKAQTLNIIPGAGYLYLGQNQSALTAALLNGLFIAATVHFFQKGEIAAGIITASFEAGWYFGGIYGAGEQAKRYNERLWERKAAPYMNQEKLFPILMLNYAF